MSHFSWEWASTRTCRIMADSDRAREIVDLGLYDVLIIRLPESPAAEHLVREIVDRLERLVLLAEE